jgi:RpiR family carbohydrate utilization transcriptional regulator
MILSIDQKDFDNMGSAQRKVAEFIVANPEDVERMGIMELANANRVSIGTITNLCLSLGFDNFKTFKMELAKANMMARSTGTREPVDSISKRVHNSFTRVSNAILDTRNNLDIKSFEAAVLALEKGDRIVFFGIGGSGAIAMDAGFRFLRLGINAVSYNDNHIQFWSTLTLNHSDVVIVISHSGKTPEPIEALSLAKSLGCTTIAVTSHPFSPLAKLADIRLISTSQPSSPGEGSVLARFSQEGIFDALAEELIYRNPEYLRHSERVESVLLSRRR